MSVKEHIKALARDLTSLEINTIRRTSITGETMPDPRHALYDVAAEYNQALNRALKGDQRTLEGADCIMRCRFVAPYHDPGQSVVLQVELRDPTGKPMANEPVVGFASPAPSIEPTRERGKARVVMRPGVERPSAPTTTDARGIARLTFTLADDDRPGVAVRVEGRGLKTEMQIPLRKVHGDLHAFYYLNHRANEAPDCEQEWLVRRIELNAVRLGAMLERLPPPPGADGCDANNYSRRHLNGAPEKEGDPQREKPPAMALPSNDLVTLRKIWELGCEEILMQTVVQLDGDVVTRLAEEVATEDASIIHRVHSEGVRVAVQSWKNLVDSLGSFARALIGGG